VGGEGNERNKEKRKTRKKKRMMRMKRISRHCTRNWQLVARERKSIEGLYWKPRSEL
jgi:hypothetical protein